jgi:hypothetical protein
VFTHIDYDHPEIIQAMDVVSMGMCVYYRVQRTDLSIQKLGAHIW